MRGSTLAGWLIPCVALLCAAGCQQGGVVEVRLHGTIANAAGVRVDASVGSRTSHKELPYAAPAGSDMFSFAIAYPPDLAGTMTVKVTLVDADGQPVGAGTNSVMLVPHGTTPSVTVEIGPLGPGGCPAAAICQDFESDLQAPWRVVSGETNGNLIRREAGVAHGGTAAMHVHLDGTAAPTLSIGEDGVFPSTATSTVYVRSYVRFSQVPDIEMALLLTQSLADASQQVTLNASRGSYKFFDGIDNGASNVSTSTPAIVANQWICLQWMIGYGSPGSTQLWVDNVDVPAFHGTRDILPSKPFSIVALGVVASSPGAKQDIYFDDVVISPDKADTDCQ